MSAATIDIKVLKDLGKTGAAHPRLICSRSGEAFPRLVGRGPVPRQACRQKQEMSRIFKIFKMSKIIGLVAQRCQVCGEPPGDVIEKEISSGPFGPACL